MIAIQTLGPLVELALAVIALVFLLGAILRAMLKK